MAYTPQQPPDVIANWSEDGTNVTFPIASVPEMTAAEADATTGDARKVIFALMEQFYQWYAGLGTNVPANIRVRRSTGFNDQTDGLTRTYTVTVELESSGLEVIAEA